MKKKETRIAAAGFALSAFLLLCAIINFAGGHMGAAAGSLGTGVFFFALSFAAYRKGA